jgi:hypothetical protein
MSATRGVGRSVYGRVPSAAAGSGPYPRPRRIRLVAYGARLESGLGAIPQGFKSPILRQKIRGLGGSAPSAGVREWQPRPHGLH